MYKLIGLTLLVAKVSALTTIEPTTTTDGRIWKCESEISKYNNSYCNQPGNSTGCYCPGLFGTCKSCGFLCNDVQEYSSDEKSCNHSCPDYLSQDGECTLAYDVRTTTLITTSAIPSTTTNKTFTKPTTTNHTVATTTTHGSRSSSSCVVTGVVTGLVCLVIGAVGVGGTCFYFKRKGQPQEPPPADKSAKNGNKSSEVIEMEDESEDSLLNTEKGKRTDNGDQ